MLDEKDYNVWERDFMKNMVTHEAVHENQSELIMDLDFYQFAELVDIKPRRGGHFIHSMSEPRSEEDIEDKVMHNWLTHSDKIFPIHTEAPQLFKKITSKAQTTKYGKKYTIP